MVAIKPVTHDLRHLVLKLVDPGELKFFPGQYVDIQVPGWDATRSFSMANTSSRESGQLEFVIKVYPGGIFSEFLDRQLQVGHRLELSGPFGVFTLRDNPDARLIFVGGGAGMAPILALLRSMAERGIDRHDDVLLRCPHPPGPVLRRGVPAARGDAARFRYVPALSEDEWDGEVGLITDVVRRHEPDLTGADAYVCGPPPMVEAAIPMLEGLGVVTKRIYYDKFTTTGDAGDSKVLEAESR